MQLTLLLSASNGKQDGFFLRDFGVAGVFTFIAASMLVVMLSIGVFGPRTRGLALEDISR